MRIPKHTWTYTKKHIILVNSQPIIQVMSQKGRFIIFRIIEATKNLCSFVIWLFFTKIHQIKIVLYIDIRGIRKRYHEKQAKNIITNLIIIRLMWLLWLDACIYFMSACLIRSNWINNFLYEFVVCYIYFTVIIENVWRPFRI